MEGQGSPRLSLLPLHHHTMTSLHNVHWATGAEHAGHRPEGLWGLLWTNYEFNEEKELGEYIYTYFEGMEYGTIILGVLWLR